MVTLERIAHPKDFIFDPSLVLYLPLYRLDGASIMSRDAYGHLCMVTGAFWTPQGRSFDGGDDDINAGNTSVLNFTTSAFSILAWIKPDTAQNMEIYCRGFWNTDGYRVWFNSAGKLYFDTYQSVANQRTLSADGAIDTTGNVWQFIMATREGSAAKLYKNMIDITDTAASHIDPAASTRNAYIGRYDSGTSRFGGLIGEVWVFSRLLTPLERQHIYLATKWRYR